MFQEPERAIASNFGDYCESWTWENSYCPTPPFTDDEMRERYTELLLGALDTIQMDERLKNDLLEALDDIEQQLIIEHVSRG